MKRVVVFSMLFVFSIFAFGQLGLRTITPLATETAPSTATEEATAIRTLGLRTVDPLLQSFREGWSAPEDQDWSSQSVGDIQLKLPPDFSLSIERYGSNYDVVILDQENQLFGRLFYYQLESYDLQEIFTEGIVSFYGEGTVGDKSFEEKREFSNGLAAYLISMKMLNESVDFPVVIVYTPKDTLDLTSPGSVGIFVFEPTRFAPGSELDKAKEIMAGIVGSYIFQPDTRTDHPTPPTSIYSDPLIAILASLVEDEDFDFEVDMEEWLDVEGETFAFAMQPEFSVEFTTGDGFEVADLGLRGIIVAKLLVGEFEETATTAEIVEEVVWEYLGGFGDYVLIESYSGTVDNSGSININALDFSGQLCWIVVFSESLEPETFGPGEFFVFIGLAEEENKQEWAQWYAGVLLTLTF